MDSMRASPDHVCPDITSARTAPHKARPLDEDEYNKLIAWWTSPIRMKAVGTVDKNDLYRGSIRDSHDVKKPYCKSSTCD